MKVIRVWLKNGWHYGHVVKEGRKWSYVLIAGKKKKLLKTECKEIES